MDPTARPVIGSQEVARRLRTSVRSVAYRAKRGSIPGVFKVGRCLEFDEATLEAWRREKGDPNAKPAEAFEVDPLPFQDSDNWAPITQAILAAGAPISALRCVQSPAVRRLDFPSPPRRPCKAIFLDVSATRVARYRNSRSSS